MNDLLGGAGGLGGLIDLLGGGGTSKTTGKTTGKSRSKSGSSSGGGVAQLLPALTGLLGAGGLQAIIGGFQTGGLGDIIGSWVGGGPNKPVTQAQVKKGVGKDKIAKLAADTGMSPAEVTKHLTTLLPAVVNHVTPQGSVPAPSSLESALQGLQALLPKG